MVSFLEPTHPILLPLLCPPNNPAISNKTRSASISPLPRFTLRLASASLASHAHRSAWILASSSPPQPQTSTFVISNHSWKSNLLATLARNAPPPDVNWWVKQPNSKLSSKAKEIGPSGIVPARREACVCFGGGQPNEIPPKEYAVDGLANHA